MPPHLTALAIAHMVGHLPIFASGYGNGTIKLWNLSTGQLLCALSSGHGKNAGISQRSIQSLAFSSDGHQLISGGADLTIRLWDIQKSF